MATGDHQLEGRLMAGEGHLHHLTHSFNHRPDELVTEALVNAIQVDLF